MSTNTSGSGPHANHNDRFGYRQNVFQVHGIDAAEKVIVRKQLRRGQMLAFFKALPPCLVGMEACATSHYWARELTKLGHPVRLMPAKDVKAYVKRNKNDAADAQAICEAVRRPTMRYQIGRAAGSVDAASRARPFDASADPTDQCFAGAYGGLGIVVASGREGVKELLKIIATEQDARLPVDAHTSLVVLAGGSGAADDDRIDREADHCSASLGRSKQAAQEHPWDWHCGCDRNRRHRPGPKGLSIGS